MRHRSQLCSRARPSARLVGAALCLTALMSVAHARAADTIVPPHVRTQVAPAWPANQPSDHDLDVIVIVTVAADGAVLDAHVDDSVGADYDNAAIDAVKHWQFDPATRNGQAIPARVRALVHFETPAHEAPPPAAPTPAPPEAPDTATPAAATAASNAGPTQASPVAAPEVSPAPAEPTEITVAGRARPPTRGASDFSITVGELQHVPRKNASELLKLAPGVLLTNESGEGHAEQVFLRGFDAKEGQDIEFSLGGMPINESGNLHGNGYADTHFIIPELVSSLRIVEGPFDPRQGNYAVAGSANYELGLAQRGFTAKYTGGSFGTERLLLLWGPDGESSGTLAGAEIYKTNGFGQNRDAERATAMGQYEGRVGKDGSYRILATAYATHFHSAGVIREDDYEAGRIGFYDSYDSSSFANEKVPEGGDSSRYSLSGDVETRSGDARLSQQVFLTYRSLRLLENFTGFLLDVQEPLQSSHIQRGDEIDLNVNEVTIGARGAARWQTTALGEPQHLELGYFARGDVVSGVQQRLEAATGVPYQTDADLDSNLSDIGVYADADLKLLHWLSLRGGVRSDFFGYAVTDNCAAHTVAHPSTTNPPIDQSCLTQQDMGRPREADQRSSTSSIAVLPRASLIFGPFSGISLSASYGQGVRSADPIYITQNVPTPFSSITAYEGGATFARQWDTVSVTAQSVFFLTHVDKDLIFDETQGRNVLGVGTTRTGWTGATRVTGQFFDESLNLTLVKSEYDDTHLLVAYVPGVVLRSDTALFRNLTVPALGRSVKGSLGVGSTYVGPRALPYGERSNAIFTIDSTATVGWSHYELGLTVTNLLGTQYRDAEFDYASDFHSPNSQPTLVPERTFTAGAPRAIFGNFAINFGGA
ncbi:MAG TPA: TonB family protein [Polyangiaceae bacterium]|nr:TonB family protein [Polyangiaceae bacterium]